MNRSILYAAIFGALAIGSVATAQPRPKARVMVLIDTAGSMGLHFGNPVSLVAPPNGDYPGGDGSTTYSDANLTNANLYPGKLVGGARDGVSSRLYAVKKALADAANATGDIEFGLMTFDFQLCAFNNPLCELCAIASGTNYNCLYADNNFTQLASINWRAQGCTGPGNGGRIITVPAAGSAMKLLPWIDGVEDHHTSGDANTAFGTGATPLNPEIRADGINSLAEAIAVARTQWFDTAKTTDAQINCRPYALVIITDSVESTAGGCGADPVAAVQALFNDGNVLVPPNPVLTHVIGVSSSSADQAALNSIASAGGTGQALFANSAAEVEAAVAHIVRHLVGSDCNGNCPAPGTPPPGCPCNSNCVDNTGHPGICQPVACGPPDVCTCQPPPTAQLQQRITELLSAGTCVPQGSEGSPSSTGFNYCDSAGCSGGAIGCSLSFQLHSLTVGTPGAGHASVDMTFDVSGVIHLDGHVVSVPASCSLSLSALNVHLQADLSYAFDANTGKYAVTNQTLNIPPVFNWQLGNCGVLSSFGSLINSILVSVEGTAVTYLSSSLASSFDGSNPCTVSTPTSTPTANTPTPTPTPRPCNVVTDCLANTTCNTATHHCQATCGGPNDSPCNGGCCDVARGQCAVGTGGTACGFSGICNNCVASGNNLKCETPAGGPYFCGCDSATDCAAGDASSTIPGQACNTLAHLCGVSCGLPGATACNGGCCSGPSGHCQAGNSGAACGNSGGLCNTCTACPPGPHCVAGTWTCGCDAPTGQCDTFTACTVGGRNRTACNLSTSTCCIPGGSADNGNAANCCSGISTLGVCNTPASTVTPTATTSAATVTPTLAATPTPSKTAAATTTPAASQSTPTPTAPLVITTASLPSCQIGTFYSFTLTAVGGIPPYIWGELPLGATENGLPPGLTISTSGAITGTPNHSGFFAFTLVVLDFGTPQQRASRQLFVDCPA